MANASQTILSMATFSACTQSQCCDTDCCPQTGGIVCVKRDTITSFTVCYNKLLPRLITHLAFHFQQADCPPV